MLKKAVPLLCKMYVKCDGRQKSKNESAIEEAHI